MPRVAMFDLPAAQKLREEKQVIIYHPGHGYELMDENQTPEEGLLSYPPFCELKDTRGSMGTDWP